MHAIDACCSNVNHPDYVHSFFLRKESPLAGIIRPIVENLEYEPN